MFRTPPVLFVRQFCTLRGTGRLGNQLSLWLRSSSKLDREVGHPTRKINTAPGSFKVTNDMSKIISIEGNIGVGKTTLAYKLGDLLNYSVFVEPTAKNPYLARFYADPKKYATKLQLWIFKQRYLIYTEALNHFFTTRQGVILDRSVFSDEVFAHVGHELANISDDGFFLYNEIRKKAIKSLMPPHLFIYLDATPQVCLDRIKSRGRTYEKNITTQYLSLLDDEYQNFRNNIKTADIPELCVDWSNIGSAELVARDINSLYLKSSNGSVLEKHKNYVKLFSHKNMLSSFITELDSELSENEEDNCDLQIAERDAFKLENS